MKITLVVPIFPALSETFILNHITGLLNEGHDVRILAMSKNPAQKQHAVIGQYQLLKRTKYLRQPLPNKTYRRIVTLCLMLYYTIRFPCRLFRVVKALRNQAYCDFYQRLYFSFAVMSDNSDIYHFHFAQVARPGAFVKKAGIPITMVTSLHGYDINLLPRNHDKDFYSDLFQECDRFVANTHFTKQQAAALGCDEEKISVIPVGLHVREFPFRDRSQNVSNPVRILTVGRLVEKKGHLYSIQAIARLIRKGYSIRYTIAGDGPLKSDLQKLAVSLGIEQHVTFCGEQAQDEIIKLYDQSEIFVLSSVTASNGDKEGQGLVLQEAQACGLPVVSTLHNGIPEGVIEGTTGYLVPEKDVDSLAGAIEKLLLAPDLWRTMGRAGRSLVESTYEMKHLTAQMTGLYQEVIDSASGQLQPGFRNTRK